MYLKNKLYFVLLVYSFLFCSFTEASLVPFQLTYTNTEYQYGNVLSHLVSELSQNRLSQQDLSILLKIQTKASAFIDFDESLIRLKQMSNITDQDSFYKNCSATVLSVNKNSESIEERIEKSLDRYCRYLFLNRLSKLSSSSNFSTRDLKFLTDAALFFITGENQDELISFFKKFKSNVIESEKISAILAQKYMEYKIRPPAALLTQMNISSKFNSFLQKNINLDDKAARVFQEEYQRTIKDARNAIDKGDYALATKLSRSSLNFYQNNKNFVKEDKAWNGTTLIAKEFCYKDQEEKSLEFFNAAKMMSTPNKDQESTYNLLWNKIINRDDKGLLATIQKNNLEISFSKFDSKLQFWIAYAFYKVGDQKKAFDYFEKIITINPFSYYSILSLKILASHQKDKNNQQALLDKWINKTPIIEYPMNQISTTLKHALTRLAIWDKIKNDKFMAIEIKNIQSLEKTDLFKNELFTSKILDKDCKNFININLVRFLNSKNQYLSSFKIFYSSLEENSLALNYKFIKYIFPLNYLNIIKKNSLSIDPLVIISLVRQESGFNPDANSVVGAKGLMQLMPATAKRFNRRLKAKHLNNPEINLTIGIKYLKQLLVRYDGNLIFALAAYNAGENRIDRWKKEIFKSEDPLAMIEAIPYEETRNYVKLIYRNYFIYNLLSEKSILMTPIQDSFQVSIKR